MCGGGAEAVRHCRGALQETKAEAPYLALRGLQGIVQTKAELPTDSKTAIYGVLANVGKVVFWGYIFPKFVRYAG